MNTRQLARKIVHNWPAKAICLVLGAMIYFFHQMSLVDTKELSVSLEVRAEGEMEVLPSPENVTSVSVRVRAARDQISSVTAEDITAYVDISSCTEEGTFAFPVHVEPLERARSIDPLELYTRQSEVTLSVERRVAKAVPLVAQVVGEPAHGYIARDATCTPDFVMLEGASSVVAGVESMEVTAVSVEGATGDVTRDEHVINTNEYITVMEGDLTVSVSVPVEEELMTRAIDNVPVFLQNLRGGLTYAPAEPAVRVRVEGPLLLVERLAPSAVRAAVNCASVTSAGQYELPVRVTLPPRMWLSGGEAPTLTLRVESVPPADAAAGDAEEAPESGAAPVKEDLETPASGMEDAPEGAPAGTEGAAEAGETGATAL